MRGSIEDAKYEKACVGNLRALYGNVHVEPLMRANSSHRHGTLRTVSDELQGNRHEVA